MTRFQEAPPPEALRPYVQCLWRFEAGDEPPATHHVPPDGCVSIVLAQRPAGVDAIVVGPRLDGLAVPLAPGARYLGIRMRPEAAGLLLGITPREWVGRVAPLALASPALAQRAVTRDVDSSQRTLLATMETGLPAAVEPDPLVRDALVAMEKGEWRVEAIARHLGVSTRTLQRRFLRAAGLPPKAFARIRRFRQAMSRVLDRPAPEWGRVAAEHGFADQAHLAREVAALTGAPPATAARRLAQIEHVDVRP